MAAFFTPYVFEGVFMTSSNSPFLSANDVAITSPKNENAYKSSNAIDGDRIMGKRSQWTIFNTVLSSGI